MKVRVSERSRRVAKHLAIGVSIMLMAVLGPSPVAAQQDAFPENSLVQGPDGSLYVFEGGALHPIAPVPATVQQLTTAPRANPVTTGITIIPEAVAQPPCGEGFQVRVCILGVQRPFAGSFAPAAGLEFVLSRVRFENLRDEPFLVPAYEIGIQGTDVNGSARGWGSGGNTPPIPEPIDTTSLAPGRALEGNAIIALPAAVPITSVTWVLGTNPFQSVEAPIP